MKTGNIVALSVVGLCVLWGLICVVNNANHPTYTSEELYAGHVAGELFKANLRNAFDK